MVYRRSVQSAQEPLGMERACQQSRQVETMMWTWSGMRCPSITGLSFRFAKYQNIAPKY
jgi:hypothetical protein